jgi:hypothetical protein
VDSATCPADIALGRSQPALQLRQYRAEVREGMVATGVGRGVWGGGVTETQITVECGLPTTRLLLRELFLCKSSSVTVE